MSSQIDHLGFGIITPFRRDGKSDFAADGGEALVKSALEQIIGTRGTVGNRQGEVPWRTEMGSAVSMLRHRPNDFATRELARASIESAIRRWEPRILLEDVTLDESDVEGVTLSIRIRYSLIDQNVSANRVVGPFEAVVEI